VVIHTRRWAIALVFLAFALVSFEVTPVAALFGNTFYTPYEYSGTDTCSSYWIPVSADRTAGECKIEVKPMSWFEHYSVGAYGLSWVGSDDTMSQTVTATWCISSAWTLNYYLGAGRDWIWTSSMIELSVVYQVYDALGSLLQEKVAWSALVHKDSGSYWDYQYGTINMSVETRFTIDLQNGIAYVFKVALKVEVLEASPYYDLNANSDHNKPACLTVSSIQYYLP
jgi:hypothetical protein